MTIVLAVLLASLGAGGPETEASNAERRGRFSEAAPFDLLSGQADHVGDWALEASVGFPWQRLRGQVGVARRLTLGAEVETLLGRRFRPAASLGFALVEERHARVTGEVGFGWLVQRTPERPNRGPSWEGRLRAAFPVSRVAPYLTVALRPTSRYDRLTTERVDGSIDVRWANRPMLTLWSTVGMGIAINEHVGLDFGFDIVVVDVPSVSIPGVHVGLQLGGWGR